MNGHRLIRLVFLAVGLPATALRAADSLLPQPQPPKAMPAPPRTTPRVLPLEETIPDWQARWELARALSYLKRYDESIAEYRKVMAARPADLAVRQDYGQVLLWAGRAEESYAELSRIPANQLTPAEALAVADTQVARKQYAEAEAIYRGHIQRDPGDQLTRLKLAEILSWTKRYDESLQLYRTILAELPDDVQVRRRYALVLLWAGRPEDSAAEPRRTITE
jgi:tetratricopeptide (TPR) repeat protein